MFGSEKYPQPCVLCDEPVRNFYESHNPAPLADHGRCCEACNWSLVIPARIAIHAEAMKPAKDK